MVCRLAVGDTAAIQQIGNLRYRIAAGSLSAKSSPPATLGVIKSG